MRFHIGDELQPYERLRVDAIVDKIQRLRIGPVHPQKQLVEQLELDDKHKAIGHWDPSEYWPACVLAYTRFTILIERAVGLIAQVDVIIVPRADLSRFNIYMANMKNSAQYVHRSKLDISWSEGIDALTKWGPGGRAWKRMVPELIEIVYGTNIDLLLEQLQLRHSLMSNEEKVVLRIFNDIMTFLNGRLTMLIYLKKMFKDMEDRRISRMNIQPSTYHIYTLRTLREPS